MSNIHTLCKAAQDFGKKERNLQRIPGLKELPVIMANGSNLVGGVNELVPSIDVADWHSLSPRTII